MHGIHGTIERLVLTVALFPISSECRRLLDAPSPMGSSWHAGTCLLALVAVLRGLRKWTRLEQEASWEERGEGQLMEL